MNRLFAALLLGLSVLAPGIASAAGPVFASAGLVGLVPPPGMIEAGAVQGFEDRDAKASILIVEMPKPAFDEVTKSFTDASLADKGVTVTSRKDVDLAGGAKGLLIVGSQTLGSATVKKWILVAGGETAAALITAQLPAEASARYSDEAIDTALRSVVFRGPPPAAELLARLPFRLSDLQGYRVVKVIGPSVLLTKGDSDQFEGAGQPYFIAAAGQAEVRDDDRANFARRLVASVPGVRELKMERGGPLRITGQPGYEILATGADARTGKPVKLAQWVRFGRGGYVSMVGVAPTENFDADFDAMRAIREGIEAR